MSINFNHVTNDITASSGSVSINGSVPSGGGASAITISNKTAAYTIVAGDLGKIINCTSGTFTVSLTAAATLGSGFNCWIWNTSSTVTDAITIDPNGAETIDGVATLILRRGEGCQIVCDGTNWQTGDKKTMRGYAENIPAVLGRPIASGSEAVAISNESVASGQGCLATQGGTASSNYSTAIGRTSAGAVSQAVTNSGAMALGGSYASGADSFAAAVANNTSSYGATGANSVAIGQIARAAGQYSVAIGRTALATQDYSFSLFNGSAEVVGKIAVGIGGTVATGTQYGLVSLYRQTADATPTALSSNGGSASTNNQVILPNNSAYAFTGTVVARRQASGGTQSAAWKVEGLIRREGSAGTTTLVASTVTAISNVPGWTLALSADTTNGGLAVTATGAAATNIRWVATIDSSEVIYA